MPKDLTLQTTASGDTSRVAYPQGATPAPWCVGYSDGSGPEYIVDTNGNAVATVLWGCSCCKPQRELKPEERATARLIAQSPALLAALKLVFAEMQEQCVPSDDDDSEWAATYIQVANVIAAAEGSDRP